jgi:acetyl-CoA C-acetyltransferase
VKETVFVSAVRTPIGKYMGSLKTVRVQDLAAHTMKVAVERAGIDSSALEMSIYAQSMQSSLPANVGRHAWLQAGLSEDPAGFTLNTLCAGALQTMISGFNKITGDEYQGMLVGGVESYSMSQYYIYHPRYEMGFQSMCFHDQKVEIETNAQPQEQYGRLTAASTADTIAETYGLARKELDAYAVRDHERALVAIRETGITGDVAPLTIKMGKKEVAVNVDELPRTTTLEALMAMPPENQGGTATAANLAPWADGAASLIMLSAQRAKDLGCKALAKMSGFGVAAGHPLLLERTTLRSIRKALTQCGLTLEDMDILKIHTPSAAYGLALEEMLGETAACRMNPDGGSLAFGHAGAATGAIMAADMIHRLARTGARWGLINVGALGGQSLTIIIEGC